jgi:hypothetical protein
MFGTVAGGNSHGSVVRCRCGIAVSEAVSASAEAGLFAGQ